QFWDGLWSFCATVRPPLGGGLTPGGNAPWATFLRLDVAVVGSLILHLAGRRLVRGGWVLLGQGRIGDVMAFDPVTVDTLLRRRRFGRSEALGLVAAGPAFAVGAAAWLTEADTAVVSEATANIASFDERFVPLTPSEMFQMRAA